MLKRKTRIRSIFSLTLVLRRLERALTTFVDHKVIRSFEEITLEDEVFNQNGPDYMLMLSWNTF